MELTNKKILFIGLALILVFTLMLLGIEFELFKYKPAIDEG